MIRHWRITPVQHSRFNSKFNVLKTMKKIILFTLLGVMVLRGMSQITLTGTVKSSSSGEPLQGAHVQLDKHGYGSISDINGKFMLKDLSPGKYKLTITFLGYAPHHQPLVLEKDQNLEIMLQPSPILENEVIIESTRAGEKAPLAFQEIGKLQLAASNQGKDLPYLLSNSISAVTTSDAGNGVGYTAMRIRGTDMTRINVTVNGIPLNDPESHNVFWVDLPDVASSTDNIQIQRGVGTSTNGAAAFGASINLLTAKIPEQAFGEMQASYGSFQTGKWAASFGSGLIDRHWSFSGRISSIHSDGYIDRASSDLLSYHLATSYASAKSLLRFSILSGTEKTYQAWDGVPGVVLDTNRTYNGIGAYYDRKGRLFYYDNETDNYNQAHYQLHFSHQASSFLFLNLAAHYTKGKGYYEQYKESENLADYGLTPFTLPSPWLINGPDSLYFADSILDGIDLIRRKWLDNDYAGLTYSLSWNSASIKSSLGGSWNTYIGRHFGRIIWSEAALGFSPDYEWYRSKAGKQGFNLYAKTTYDLNRHISFYLDLQYRNILYGIDGVDDDSRNITQDHSFSFFNPKAGVFITMDPKNTAYLSFAKASREPNRDNFVDADPLKPLPRPETLYDLELGHQYRSGKFSFSSNAYLMIYQDQLALTGAINDVGAPVMENVDNSYRIGIEISMMAQLNEWLQWSLNTTLSRNKVKAFTEYIDNWDTWSQETIHHENTDISFSPSLIAGNEFQFKLSKNSNLSFLSKYVSKQYLDNTQDESRKLDAFFVNDLRFSHKVEPGFCKELTFNIYINNIFNHLYETNAWVYRYKEGETYKVLDGYFPQAGIHFMAGLVIRM